MSDEQERNRRLAAIITAGRSPMDSEIMETLRQQAAANLDVPGPRVLQLIDELEQFRAVARRILEAHREGWTPILQDDADELARLTEEPSR